MKNHKISLARIFFFLILLTSLGLAFYFIYSKSSNPQDNPVNHSTPITSVADFYQIDLPQSRDLRKLPSNYTIEDAKKDHLPVNRLSLSAANQLIENYKSQKTTHLQIALTTVEGDLILRDVLYYAPTKQLLVVTDDTRDQFSSKENRTITLTEYHHLEIINDKHGQKLFAYQGDQFQPLSSSQKTLFLAEITE